MIPIWGYNLLYLARVKSVTFDARLLCEKWLVGPLRKTNAENGNVLLQSINLWKKLNVIQSTFSSQSSSYIFAIICIRIISELSFRDLRLTRAKCEVNVLRLLHGLFSSGFPIYIGFGCGFFFHFRTTSLATNVCFR